MLTLGLPILGPTGEDAQITQTEDFFMMKRLCLSILLSAPLAVWAADATPDSSFYKNAAEAGISEVDAGNLASEKATDPKVKDFGAMMVKDHSAANDKLKALADTKGVKLPTSASVGQMATQAKLKVLSGDTFDKSYIKGQIKAHQDTIALLKKEIASGQDAEAKAFAQTILPTVRAHLKAANAIAAADGVSK
jgi:putative membrane protein